MLRSYPLITHDSTSAGMKKALAVSILAHGLMLLFFMQHLLTPPASRSSGSRPLHMSLKATRSKSWLSLNFDLLIYNLFHWKKFYFSHPWFYGTITRPL